MVMYSDKVMEHFMCPQNAHSMPDADAEGSFGDPNCGDFLTMYLRIKDNSIEEVSYLVFGCCASVATSSMTSVLAKGKSLDEAMKITEEDIVEALDGLPEEKLHCSNLGVSALRSAIDDYKNKTDGKQVSSYHDKKESIDFMDIIEKMMIDKYGETLVNHMNKPRNFDVLKDSNGYVSYTGECGDIMQMWIKIIDNIIKDISFCSDGCEITLAAGSMITELVKGKNISDALNITPADIEKALGCVPDDHYHSLVLAKDVLKKVIENYKENNENH